MHVNLLPAETPDTNIECRRQLLRARFADGFSCPKCGHDKGYELRTRNKIECANKDCRAQTSGTSGTVFHKSKKLTSAFTILKDYCQGIHKSARQIASDNNVCYLTAWKQAHRIRLFLKSCVLSADGVRVPLEQVHMAVFKKCNDGGGEVEEERPACEPAPLLSTTEQEMVVSFIQFLLCTFHGVSRKYAANYAAEFSFNQMILDSGGKDAFNACIRAAPDLSCLSRSGPARNVFLTLSTSFADRFGNLMIAAPNMVLQVR